MAIQMKFFKMKTQYAEKWHIISGHGRVGTFVSSLCGYPAMRGMDKLVAALPPDAPLCKTCLLVRAHEKQKLHRV